MDFDYTEDQRALEDTVRRFVAKDYTFEARNAIRASAAGWSREVWVQLADLGVLAINVPEEHGGLGYGPLETGLAMNAFGAGLLLEPFLGGAVIAPALIRRAATPDFQAEWLPRIAGGEAIVIPVPGQTLRIANGSISGQAGCVVNGATADLLLVVVDDTLHAIAPDAPGVARRDYPLLDGRHAAAVQFDNVAATPFGDGACTAVDAALDIGLAALCAEAVGILDATVAATADYLRTRKQFGQPIGRFQALQHRMADMLLHVEQARSMSLLAAMRCEDDDIKARRRVLSAAKVTIGNACRFVGQNAVQLHGGMGMTDELIVSHWFKRLTSIELSFGDTETHLQRFAALSRAAA